jgi:GTP diphosphokinase / guanosine-3',5'-bis(diphosphate) 3'-diphosphatase
VNKLAQAINCAAWNHREQMDTDGMPHSVHVLRVMIAVSKAVPPEGYTKEEVMIAAALHDVVEDTDLTLDDIEKEWGKLIRDVVDALTRRKYANETYRDFIYRAKANPAARLIKTADLLDNIGRITPDLAGIEKRYSTALAVLNDADEPSWETAGWEYRNGRKYVADPEGRLTLVDTSIVRND